MPAIAANDHCKASAAVLQQAAEHDRLACKVRTYVALHARSAFANVIPAKELVKKSHLREGSCDSLGKGSIRGART